MFINVSEQSVASIFMLEDEGFSGFSETLLNIYRTARTDIPEVSNLHTAVRTTGLTCLD
jgi:hypothetical protein